MKIIYDHQAFSFQEYGGISRYFSELLRFFRKDNRVEPGFLIKYSNNNYISDIVKAKSFSPNYRFKGRNKIIELLNRFGSKNKLIRDKDYDLFHPTYYDPYFLKAINNIPFVLTIHDMAHEYFPDSFSKFDFTANNKKILALKAEKIIATSEFTKKNIIRNYNIPESKIDVVYHASSISLLNAETPACLLPHLADGHADKTENLPDSFILFVGKRNTYKNFPFFLKAVKKVLSLKSNFYVVCAGGGKFNKNEIKLLNTLDLSDKIMQTNADDNSLAYIYSKATAFVFPSLYEGFGIPVLEAFACGCPAVLSNNTALPEIGDSAALYFDPKDVDSLIAVLMEILENAELRNELKKKGIAREALFSWEKTAEKTLKIYKKAIKSK